MLPRAAIGGILLAFVWGFASASGQAALHLREGFDGSVAEPLTPGCAGSVSDWERPRDLEDPKNGSLKSRGVENESCILLPGSDLENGAVTVRLRIRAGQAGVALRHADPDHYLGVYLDPNERLLSAVQWNGNRPTKLSTSLIDPPGGGFVELTAAVRGGHVSVFLDGKRVLDAAGAAEVEGKVGMLAGALASAEFDEAVVEGWPESRSVAIIPAVLPAAWVGKPWEASLGCRFAGAGDDRRAGTCTFAAANGRLPEGLSLEPSGKISGTPEKSGAYDFDVEAAGPGGKEKARSPFHLNVNATAWPRFPLEPGSFETPALAVVYTSDDISQSIVLSTLGSPDKYLFRMHAEHPDVKVTLMSCPANRYIHREITPVTDSSVGSSVWKALALDPRYSWIDLGGHGYTHSPPGDTNIDHHEFSTVQKGCNIDHRRMGDAAYCRTQMQKAREVYRALGIPDADVTVMRFPGAVDNPEALRAAREAGFAAVMGRRHPEEAGREWWVPAAGGLESLEIEDSVLRRQFTRSKRLETALADGKLKPGDVSSSPAFKAAVARGIAYIGRIVADGGIFNMADHFWGTFEDIGGAEPRYMVLDAVLRDTESRYAGRIWYPRAAELAQWLLARRGAEVSWSRDGGGVLVTVKPPAIWTELHLKGLDRASLRVALPEGSGPASKVLLREGAGAWLPLDEKAFRTEEGSVDVTFPFKGEMELRIVPGAKAGSVPAGDPDGR